MDEELKSEIPDETSKKFGHEEKEIIENTSKNHNYDEEAEEIIDSNSKKFIESL